MLICSNLGLQTLLSCIWKFRYVRISLARWQNFDVPYCKMALHPDRLLE